MARDLKSSVAHRSTASIVQGSTCEEAAEDTSGF
jgi:hypothetical protein